MARRTDLGDPRAPVERAEHARRDDQLAVGVGVEGQRADRDGTRTREVDGVVDGDRGQTGLDVGRPEPGRDPRGDDARAVVQPGEPTGVEAVERVGRGIDLTCDRVQPGDGVGGGHARVPVRSSTEPPVRKVCCTSWKPARARRSASSGAAGR